MMKRFVKGLPILLLITVMMVGTVMGGSVYAQEEAFWTDNSGNRFTGEQLALAGDTPQVISLKADVPAGKTLEAYTFTVTYDHTVVEIINAEKMGMTTFINDDVPGQIRLNGMQAQNGPTGPVVVDLANLTLKGVANGTTTFSITADTYGSLAEPNFPLTTVPLTVIVSGIAQADNKAYFADASGARIPADTLNMELDDTSVITLMAEVPATKTLKAFLFTLTYDVTKVGVLDVQPSTASVFNTTINTTTPGIIVVNGFYADPGLAGAATASIVDVTVRALAATAGSAFGITVNNFGNIDTPTDEFKPEPSDLNIIIGGIGPDEGEAYFADASDIRFASDSLELAIDDTELIRVRAEIPANKTLRAYNLTLTYNTDGIGIPTIGLIDGSAFDTTINDMTPGTIEFNGFASDGVGVSGGADGMTVSLLDITVQGLSVGPSNITITVNEFGNEAEKFEPTGMPLAINVTDQPAENSTYFVDSSGTKITTLDMNANDEQTVRLVAEVPAGDLLKAYKFTVAYDNSVVEVTYVNDDISPFAADNVNTNNDKTNGVIITNGFDTTGVGEGVQTIMDVTVKALAAGTTDLAITVDAFGTDALNTFEPTPENLAITVAGAQMFTITATAGAGGSISPAGAYQVAQGATPTFTITAGTGYKIADVTVNGASVGAVSSYTFPAVTANQTITATFEQKVPPKYTITATAGANGAITPGTVTVDPGATPTFTFTPASGYVVKDVMVDGISRGSMTAYTFPGVYGNHTINVTFELAAFTITAEAGDNGAIDPAGTVGVNAGADQTFTITPADGYVVEDVLVDGVSQGDILTYTFTAIDADHTISVSFVAADTFTITVTTGENGTVTYNGAVVEAPVVVAANATPTFVFVPNEDFVVDNVIVAGNSLGSISDFNFDPVTDDYEMSVTFRPIVECNAEPIVAVTPVTGTAPLTVTFDTTGSVGDLLFEFMDGVTQAVVAGESIDHTFDEAGTYDVTLTATDTLNNCSEKITVTVTVTEGVCDAVAQLAADVTGGVAPLTVTFDTTGSVGDLSIDYGDGYTGQDLSHSYMNGGTYTATLTATDTANNCEATATVVISVSEPACEAVAVLNASPISGVAPLTVTFDTTGSVGDLSFDYGNGYTGQAATYTYDSAGTYTVSLTATDTVNGCDRSAYVTVTVTAPACEAVASLSASPISGYVPLAVTFDTSGSVGDLSIAYGDNETGTETSHTYDAVGTYLAVLTATDAANNCSKTASVSITVNAVVVEKVKLNVTASANGQLYMSDRPDLVAPFVYEVNSGSDVAFTVDPDEGYEVDTVTVDGAEVTVTNNQFTVENVTGDIGIHATYKKIELATYTVSATVADGGVIYPLGDVEVEEGSDITFTIQALSGFAISDVLVDGVSVGVISTYTFENVSAEGHSIEVSFVELPVEPPATPEASSPECGSVDVSMTPTLRGSAFSDPSDREHFWSEFQVGTNADMSDSSGFVTTTFRTVKSTPDLESVTVDEFLLQENTTYYWIVRYANDRGGVSAWSTPCSFTTSGEYFTDEYGVRIPTDKKVEVDDRDKYFPNVDLQGVSIAKLDDYNAIGVQGLGNARVMTIDVVDSGTIAAPSGISMQAGLAAYTVAIEDCDASNAEGQVIVTEVYLSEAMPEDANWYQYDRENKSMVEYSYESYPVISADRRSVTVAIENGGRFDLDADNTNCEVIVGPSGYGVATVGIARQFTVTTKGLTATFDGSTSSGQCFVWDFGDGSSDTSCVQNEGLNQVVSHTYAEAGTYAVTLMVMGANGSQTWAESVTVTEIVAEGGGDNCFITTSAYDSAPKSGMNIGLVLMLTVLAATAAFFGKRK